MAIRRARQLTEGNSTGIRPATMTEIRSARRLVTDWAAGDPATPGEMLPGLYDVLITMDMLGLSDRIDLMPYALSTDTDVTVYNVEFREWDDDPAEGWTIGAQCDDLPDAEAARERIGRRTSEIFGEHRRTDPGPALRTRIVRVHAEVIDQ
jgi:hypothetical protein